MKATAVREHGLVIVKLDSLERLIDYPLVTHAMEIGLTLEGFFITVGPN
jgi:hypothetical protein